MRRRPPRPCRRFSMVPCAALALYCSTVCRPLRCALRNGVKIGQADGVHTNAIREWSAASAASSPDRGLGGVVLQVAAACDDERTDATLTMAALLRRISGTGLGTEDVAHQVTLRFVPARRARSSTFRICGCRHCDEDIECRTSARRVTKRGMRSRYKSACVKRPWRRGLELGATRWRVPSDRRMHARALGDETPDRRLADAEARRYRCNLAVEPSISPPSIALGNGHPQYVVSSGGTLDGCRMST